MAKFAKASIDAVQIDYGIVYLNHGETGAALIGPTKGGASFEAVAKLIDLDFDGKQGKTVGMQHIAEIDAKLKFLVKDQSKANLLLAAPYLKDTTGVLTAEGSALGAVPTTRYHKNITMFAKLIGGKYKKITLYNAMAESNLGISAKPNEDGGLEVEVFAHWDPVTGSADVLYKIEEIASIV